MAPVLQGVTAIVGLMFLAAALGKLDSWPRWSATTTALFPKHLRFARAVRVIVPTSEFAVAVLTFVRPVAGLVSAATLLFVFAAGVVWIAPQQAATDCNCFGALMPSRIGRSLALRDAVLGALAASAAVVAAERGLPPFQVLEVLLIALIGIHLLLLGGLRQMPRQTLRGASEMRRE